ncbi:MAG: hypothetical protein GY953_33420, partial [bacterium]|nr:hypothetical protein [bacterium]
MPDRRNHALKLECYLLEGAEIDIRPAEGRRRWMDETGGRVAYRCLPLTIANTHGWVICCARGFGAVWNGGKDPRDVEVIPAEDGDPVASGHFGSGILTFLLTGVIFRT